MTQEDFVSTMTGDRGVVIIHSSKMYDIIALKHRIIAKTNHRSSKPRPHAHQELGKHAWW